MNLRDTAQQALLRLTNFKPSKRVTKFIAVGHLLPFGAVIAGLAFIIWYISGRSLSVLSTVGPIGNQERNLFLFALGLSLVVIIPVFFLLFVFAVRYRESNNKATYQPELSGSRTAETIWWVIPGLLIVVLSVVTWNSAHTLDPYKPIVSAAGIEPVKVQVVSLDWKWLFIYPEYDIASLNQLRLPVNTPIDLSLTSDAPMNSLWIPQLGGQVYTMQGMTTKLHLQADKIGSYRGQSANISGEGFAGMHFQAMAQSPADFADWTQRAKQSTDRLTSATYDELVKPSEDAPVRSYVLADPRLFDSILSKYMSHSHASMAAMTENSGMTGMSGMDHE